MGYWSGAGLYGISTVDVISWCAIWRHTDRRACVCLHPCACVRTRVCVLVYKNVRARTGDLPVSAQHACMYASESQRAPILNPHCTARACPRSRTADPPQTHDKNTLSHRCFFTVLSSALLWYVLRNTFPLMILCYRMCSLNSMFSE